VRALENSQRLEVLSRPQVMTLENQPAFIQIGKRVPRITGTTILSGSVSTIALENVGLLLGVTPRVSPEGMVVMEIDAERSEVAPEAEGIPVSFVNGYVLRSPNINTTLAQTTVSAADGQTIVLGGLITKSSSATDRGVPWLSDIPVVGNLFSYRARTERRTELLIILTPHVVRSPEEVDRVKRIESSRMTWCLGNVRKVHGDGGLSSNSAVPERIYPDVMPRGTPPAGPALDIYNDPLLQGAPAPPPPPASQTPADVPQGGDR
jgi:type II secretory pathway component GspD/PulD (secretin)